MYDLVLKKVHVTLTQIEMLHDFLNSHLLTQYCHVT